VGGWVACAGAPFVDVRQRADLGSLALTLAALKEWNMQESLFVLELQQAERLKTKLADLKVILEGRFGALPEDLLRRIEATKDLAKMDQFLHAAPRINRLENLPV
jgi:hypothetical protein